MITATQSFGIYEILFRHFKNEADAKAVVMQIEQVIETKFEAETDRLATKLDIVALHTAIAQLETKIAVSQSNLLKWMIVLFAPFYVGMIVFLIKQFS